jgi:hypothetical protein
MILRSRLTRSSGEGCLYEEDSGGLSGVADFDVAVYCEKSDRSIEPLAPTSPTCLSAALFATRLRGGL